MSTSTHVSMSSCLHVSPCLLVSMSMSPCFHVSMSPRLHVSMSLCLHVSIFIYPCFRIRGSKKLIPKNYRLPPDSRNSLPWTPYCKWKAELTRNSSFRLFATNRKRQTICLLQTETKNESLFSLGGKRSTIIDDLCFKKRSHLCSRVILRFFLPKLVLRGGGGVRDDGRAV